MLLSQLILAEDVTTPAVDFGPLFVKMVIATAIIIILAFVALKVLLPRLGGPRRSRGGAIRIEEAFALDAKRVVYVLEIEGQRVAIAATDHHVAKLCDLTKTTGDEE